MRTRNKAGQNVAGNSGVGLQVRRTAQGRGVFAAHDIAKGVWVCDLRGEILTRAQYKRRETLYALQGLVSSHVVYAGNCAIDATNGTHRTCGYGRLLNHSRKEWNVVGKLSPNGTRINFYAAKAIPSGSQVLWDYGDRNSEALSCHPWLRR